MVMKHAHTVVQPIIISIRRYLIWGIVLIQQLLQSKAHLARVPDMTVTFAFVPPQRDEGRCHSHIGEHLQQRILEQETHIVLPE
eukprot:gene25970-biopygen12459